MVPCGSGAGTENRVKKPHVLRNKNDVPMLGHFLPETVGSSQYGKISLMLHPRSENTWDKKG